MGPGPEPTDAATDRLETLVELCIASRGIGRRTQASYRKHSNVYDGFLSAFGQQDGSDPEMVAAYALGLVLTGRSVDSARTMLAPIASRYERTIDVTLLGREVLTAWKRQNGPGSVERAPAWPRGALLALVVAARRPSAHHMNALLVPRNVAMITAGVTGRLRPSELSMARIEHLDRKPDGFRLQVVESKTNKNHARSEYVWLGRRDDALDPVAALDALVEALARMGVTAGPLFPSTRTLNDHRQGIASGEVTRVLRYVAGRGDLPTAITGYSLRRSGATLLWLEGASLDDVRARLRHRDPDSTLRYIDGLQGLEPEAWLSSEVPAGWEPGRRQSSRVLGWDEIGSLDDLKQRALVLVASRPSALKLRSRATRLRVVRRWRDWAIANGADPDRPMPEEPGVFLCSEVDRGVNPRTVASYAEALEWWFKRSGPQASRAALIIKGVVEGIERTTPPRPRTPKVEPVDLSDVVRLVTQPALPDRWRLAVCLVARALDLPLKDVARIGLADVAFDGDDAAVAFGDRVVTVRRGQTPLFCPVAALRFLVEATTVATLVTRRDAGELAAVLGHFTGERNPSRLDDDTWQRVCDQFSTRRRVHLRNVAGVCLGLAGLLGADESVAVCWEHFVERPGGFVIRSVPGSPLPVALEGREFRSRSDALDARPALTDLSAVWPWPGEGLFGCSGPILSGLDPRLWAGRPVALSTGGWRDALRRFDRHVGTQVTPMRLRVTGALEDWDAHHDVVRLMRRMGYRKIISVLDLLSAHGVLHPNVTVPE